MAKQSINTERVATSANKLRAVNNNINNELHILQNKAGQLDRNWKSAASSVALTAMYRIFKQSEERTKVIQNYINMLEQQVNPGYINTESVNTHLADNFK